MYIQPTSRVGRIWGMQCLPVIGPYQQYLHHLPLITSVDNCFRVLPPISFTIVPVYRVLPPISILQGAHPPFSFFRVLTHPSHTPGCFHPCHSPGCFHPSISCFLITYTLHYMPCTPNTYPIA